MQYKLFVYIINKNNIMNEHTKHSYTRKKNHCHWRLCYMGETYLKIYKDIVIISNDKNQIFIYIWLFIIIIYITVYIYLIKYNENIYDWLVSRLVDTHIHMFLPLNLISYTCSCSNEMCNANTCGNQFCLYVR